MSSPSSPPLTRDTDTDTDTDDLFPTNSDRRSRFIGNSFLSSSCTSSRSLSFSSSLYFSPYHPEDSPINSIPTLRFLGIPFSWEQQPGIPKKFNNSRSKNKDPSLIMLPLPPAVDSKRFNLETIFALQKKAIATSQKPSFKRDPFVAALMECSKDDDDDDDYNQDGAGNDYWRSSTGENTVSKSLTDRFGFIDRYVSCKRSCAVLESKILVPRSNRTAYGQLIRRSG